METIMATIVYKNFVLFQAIKKNYYWNCSKTGIFCSLYHRSNHTTIAKIEITSTANPAHLPQNWAKLAVLFCWYIPADNIQRH